MRAIYPAAFTNFGILQVEKHKDGILKVSLGGQFVAETDINFRSFTTTHMRTTRKKNFIFLQMPEKAHCIYSWIPFDRFGI